METKVKLILAASAAAMTMALAFGVAPAYAQSCGTSGPQGSCFNSTEYCPSAPVGQNFCFATPTPACSGGQIDTCCGSCACPSGQTMCGSTCQVNLTCSGVGAQQQCSSGALACVCGPGYTGTPPNCVSTAPVPVYLNQASPLSAATNNFGYINVSGDIKSQGGNFVLANNQQIHVDNAGSAPTLHFQNTSGSGLDKLSVNIRNGMLAVGFNATWDGAISLKDTTSTGGSIQNLYYGVADYVNSDATTSLLLLQTFNNSDTPKFTTRFRVDKDGNVIAKSMSVSSVSITGATPLQIPGSVPAGQVLISNGSGAATWQTPAAGGVCANTRKFVGPSAATGNGSAGGYFGINAPGTGVCSSYGAGAGVCTVEEMLNNIKCSAAGDGSPIRITTSGDYWISGGPPGFTVASNDCAGWTDPSPTSYGRKWRFSAVGGQGLIGTCNEVIVYACCK